MSHNWHLAWPAIDSIELVPLEKKKKKNQYKGWIYAHKTTSINCREFWTFQPYLPILCMTEDLQVQFYIQSQSQKE